MAEVTAATETVDATRMPSLSTILLAIEARLTSLEDLIMARSAPSIAIVQAHNDLLNIRSMTAQTGEVAGHQRDQMQAIAEAMLHFNNRLIANDVRAHEERMELHAALHQTIVAFGQQGAAEQAEAARAVLQLATDTAVEVLQLATDTAVEVRRLAADTAVEAR